MFDNELSIQRIEVNSFSLERFSDLKFHFFCNEIPRKFPVKWRGEGFNALSLVIVFGDVTQLNIVGSRVGFFVLR
ncbi:Imm50 family immunity protein [Dickeya solani]|uniref:Imm50 family immunity protein n=1 Tax=Dickeya solani TaxID=1089444 RepID=UPI000A7661DF|nr:Imm50 family immunity protein [Dickeya solani]